MLLLIAPGGTIASTSRAVETMFGYRSDELIGKPASILASLDAFEPGPDDILAGAEGFMPVGAVIARHRDGSPISVHVQILRLAGQSGVFTVAELENNDADPNRAPVHRVKADHQANPIIGDSPAIKHVMAQVEHVAATDATVLLIGETGTGKELFAAEIHDCSARRSHAMVRVNCAAIPPALIESELFGHEKGAFTGAVSRQVGRFELAQQSTIFLDEIGDLPLEAQVKLLRVLEEHQFERLGSAASVRIDTRVIAATRRDLAQLVVEGRFREDLFFRLDVFPIHVPPLRERRDDIAPLVWYFVHEFSESLGKRIDTIADDTMAALQKYSWPGNVRELRNMVERAMIVAQGPRLVIHLPNHGPAANGKATEKLEDVEREHIRTVLEAAGWRVRGSGGAAERLGLKPTTLETRMARLGVIRPKHL